MNQVSAYICGVAQESYRQVPAVNDPAQLMIAIARKALADANLDAQQIDAIAIVDPFSWTYANLTQSLAGTLGCPGTIREFWKPSGGTTPQDLLHEIASAMAKSEIQAALIIGGEAMRTRRKATRAGDELPWPPRDKSVNPLRGQPPFTSEPEARHGLRLPIQIFPMLENALRHQHGRSAEAQIGLASRLLADNARVAADNPHAWFQDAPTAEDISTVTADNRMVTYPYTKRMNAIMDVDQAAALVVTSHQFAQSNGLLLQSAAVLGGAGAEEPWNPVERPSLGTCAAMSLAAAKTLDAAGVTIDEIDGFDLYSCFPSAIQLALDALGVSEDDPRPFSLTGGLAFAGGPGNAYVLHSIATAVTRLREAPDQKLLVSGIGMANTKHSMTILSAGVEIPERASGSCTYRVPSEQTARQVVAEADGQATVVTYTIEYDRDGSPTNIIYILDLADGQRTVANSADVRRDEALLLQSDPIGQTGAVRCTEERNYFEIKRPD